ncbi:MAG: hypothetical protein HQL76_06145 [Magnetococcales bacterium]|nr:hypothetical protein [Magnetococcales bacterium]
MKHGLAVSRIKGVRMVCRKCQAEWLLPLDAVSLPPRCFNCQATVPIEPLQDALRGIARLKNAVVSGSSTFEFDAVVEKT